MRMIHTFNFERPTIVEEYSKLISDISGIGFGINYIASEFFNNDVKNKS